MGLHHLNHTGIRGQLKSYDRRVLVQWLEANKNETGTFLGLAGLAE